MELNLQKEAVTACELLLDSAAEQTVECDVLLPDYCPDIVRVLCCRVDTAVSGCNVNKAAFTVEGTATVEVCYMAEVGGVRRTCYKLPFSRSFELKRQPQRPIWSANVRQGHVNCRAASKRRLDVRGAIVITAKVYDTAGQPAVSSAAGMGVQLCREEQSAVEITGQLQRRITMAEVITPPAGKQNAVEIVSVRCHPSVSETRVMASRILIKGELAVHLLYKTDPDTGALETADYNLPMSHILDEENLSDDIRCETALQCLSAECAIDDLADDGQLRLETQLAAVVRLYRPVVLTSAVDSFSTLYPTQNSLATLRVPRSFGAVSERAAVRESIPLPQGMSGLLDLRADVVEYAAENEGESVSLSAKVKFVGIISTEDTPADAFSHICDAKLSIPLKSDRSELLITPAATAAFGRIDGGQLELGCELIVSGAVIEWENRAYLTDLTVDESHPRESDPSLGLIIYYAGEGERVWDIAKRYGALPQKIMEDNALKSDILEADMPLMIPTV